MTFPEKIADWELGKSYKASNSGLLVRVVRGRKTKPWQHEEDRRVEVSVNGWIPPSLLDQAVILSLYAQNEDRLFPPPRFKGGQMVWEMIRDVPDVGPLAAYDDHVNRYRR